MTGPGAIAIVEMEVKGIDWDELESEFDGVIDEGLDTLAEEIEWSWREKAAKKLRESKEEYLDGLSVERIGNDIQGKLTGPLAVAVETGAKSFDLKPGFLGNRLSRIIPMGEYKGGDGPVVPQIGRFRTVSVGSSGWIHPGWEPRAIHEEIQEEIDDTLADKVFGSLVDQIKI